MRVHFYLMLFFVLWLLLVSNNEVYVSGLISAKLVSVVDTAKFTPVSPDPAGLEYIPILNSFYISDSEVDEMPKYFKGVNVFVLSLAGSQIAQFSTTSYTNEPTGIAYNPANNHLFFSDDNLKKIFEVDYGADAKYGTADDKVRSFGTSSFGSNDPEGLAFGADKLFVADGLGTEVYIISPGINGLFEGKGDDVISHFDTALMGQSDPEGIAYNSDKGTLNVVSNNGKRKVNHITEITVQGNAINTIDISFLNAVSTAGMAYGPGSNNPSVNNIYIVARGIDNNVDPSENDGKMYEISLGNSTPTISPTSSPTVTVGPSATISPGSTQIGINLWLHGLGKGGDNVNPSATGNMNPKRPQRTVSIEFFDLNNQTQGVKTGAITYNSLDGSFKGTIEGGTLNSGVYTVRVTTPFFLRKLYPGIINISKGTLNNLPSLFLVAGDSNNDNSLSILDYNIVLDCYSDLNAPRNCADAQKKLSADLTDDGAVNQFDYNLFLRELSVQGGDGGGGTPVPTTPASPTLAITTRPTASVTPPVNNATCLSGSGPLRTISGIQSVRYDTRSSLLPDMMKVDAGTAVWKGVHDYPVIIAGGRGICFSGGNIEGLYPASTSWDVMHGTTAMEAKAPEMTIENLRVHDYGDAVSIKANGGGFILSRLYLSYIRDDCIENDWLHTGLIEDSLFDGCYEAFSARTYSGQSPFPDGRNNVWTIRNNLIRLQAMEKVYKDRGLVPGHDGFFKWDTLAPKLALHNNIFRVDQPANNVGLGLPEGKLIECSNNIVVWLGDGAYPDTLPETFNGQPCFTITTDKTVWDNAVQSWMNRH